ncbi:hypothetical protein [Streptomyces xiamenensis]|uniref:hypothetical protein n=1 Tax=Streptomyces xiamenensis TaxID=408015 RepID=UPI0035D60EB3
MSTSSSSTTSSGLPQRDPGATLPTPDTQSSGRTPEHSHGTDTNGGTGRPHPQAV